jgi:hypothetical protein
MTLTEPIPSHTCNGIEPIPPHACYDTDPFLFMPVLTLTETIPPHTCNPHACNSH